MWLFLSYLYTYIYIYVYVFSFFPGGVAFNTLKGCRAPFKGFGVDRRQI